MSQVENLKKRFYDINALNSAISLMDWDQQTYMPKGGATARAQHVGILSRMSHELLVDDATQRLISAAASDASSDDDQALIRVAKRQYDLATKIPVDLVEEKSILSSEAHEAWVEARKNSDFASFAPTLARMFDIARQEAEYLGYSDDIYDALLDQYEEGARAADCDRMFEALKQPTVALVADITASGNQVDDKILYGDWDHAAQSDLTELLVKQIGFSFENGRQDTAPHPFCTNFAVNDVRLTTRYMDYLPSSIFSSLHEAGHGMYEQGSDVKYDRTPLAGGISLGVHESQSRTWENIVGRSLAFWQYFMPEVHKRFPAMAGLDASSWTRLINKVEPSYIRVEADEVTYNLHVLIRYEIEREILKRELDVKDLPEAWNSKMKAYLGITPRNDGEGCLQDVHWSMGAIGYFPTYSMGNLLSYQIWEKLRADLGDTDELIAKGEFAPILGWLQEKIYRPASSKTPRDLVMSVTGKPMGAEDYLKNLTSKYRSLYGI